MHIQKNSTHTHKHPNATPPRRLLFSLLSTTLLPFLVPLVGLRLLPLPLPPLLDVRRAAVAAAPDDGRAGLYHGGVEAAGGVAVVLWE